MENPAIKPEKCNSIGDSIGGPIPNYSPKPLYFSLTLIFYRVSVACIWASYQATIPDIAKTEPIQTQMNAYMYIFIYIGQIIGMILPMMILAQFPFTESAGDDYYWILNSNGIGQQIRDQIQARLVFMDIIVIVCFCIMFFFGHIPESARSQLVNLKNKSKLSFIQGFQQLFHDPDMLKIFVSNFLFLVVFGSINYIVVNFAVYSLQFGNLLYIFTILTIISSFSGFFLSNLFSSKIGLQKAFLVSNVVVSGLFLLMGVLFIPSPMIFIQIWASTLFLLASFLSAMIGVFFGSIVAKKSTTAENQTHQSRAGNYTSVYYSFGVFGNIVAVLWVSFMIEFLGSTALNTYILIFFICGMLNLGVFLLNRRLHLHSNPK